MCNCTKTRQVTYSNQDLRSKPRLIMVKLIDNTPINLRGNYTGRLYQFMRHNPIIKVDIRDTESVEKEKGLQIME
jgi:hypothetical protein